MNHINTDNFSAIVKSCSSSIELLDILKSMPQSKDSNSNVTDLINSIEFYFNETNSSVLQLLKSHTGTFEFEVCHPHKVGEEVDILLDLGCVFYMLPRFKLDY